MDYDKQIEIIRELTHKVEPYKVTILTGKNGSGKSLVRKILSGNISKKCGTDIAHTVAAVSMESRSNRKFDFSALNSAGIDDPENPTGLESLHNLDMILGSFTKDSPRYIVIDEPELGMGEEMVVAFANKLNSVFESLPEGCLGVMIITHSPTMIRLLKGEFANMEGMTREEWLNREIIPTDLEQFKQDSLGLWRAIQNYSKKN